MPEFRVIDSTLLLAIPRGRDELRIEKVRAEMGRDRREMVWYSLRVWFPGKDGWIPGKAGLTVRVTELADVLRVLSAEVAP